MPKVILSESQKEREVIESTIKKYAGAALLPIPKLAERVNISPRTLYKRLKQPETFILWELKAICKVLKIPEEEREES